MCLEARRDNKGEGKSCKMNFIKHLENFLSVFGDRIVNIFPRKEDGYSAYSLRVRDITPFPLLCLHINICLGTKTYAKEM
jgi:hypothetical protein